jgi:hypothetical protein
MSRLIRTTLLLAATLLPLQQAFGDGIVREYYVAVSPATVIPGSTTQFSFTVTNDLLTGQGNQIQEIDITIPSGFSVAGNSALTPPPYWTGSVTGNQIVFSTPQNVNGAPNPYQLFPGYGATFLIRATASSSLTAINCSDAIVWPMIVRQQSGNGSGNLFDRVGNPSTINVLPGSCFTQTKLVLNSVLPGAVMVGASSPVTIKATLTRTDTNAALAGETVAFYVGGQSVGTAATDANGVAILNNYNPSSLAAASYAVQAIFAGDQQPVPPYVNAASNIIYLAVNGQGVGLKVDPVSGTLGSAVTIRATLTANDGVTPLSGKTVSFTLEGLAQGSATTDASGVATVTSTVLTSPPFALGDYPAGVQATFAGDGVYAGTMGSADLTITALTQTITFGPLSSQTYGDAPFTVSASASSGLPVTFSASGNCTVSGSTVTITGAGSCTITAHQDGNNVYAQAPGVPQSFSVAKATATVTLSNLTQTYSGNPLTPTATTSPVAGMTIVWTGAPQTNVGSYPVTATIDNPNYTGSASGTFVINPAAAAVTLTNMNQTYTGSALSPSATTVPANLNVTWTGTPDTNVGSYPVTATINDPNYTGSASGAFVINKATAPVTLTNMNQTYTGSPLAPGATTTPANLNLTWTGTPQTSAGSYPVTATINDPNYTGSASGTFVIGKATATIVLGNMTQTYTGSPLAPNATTTPADLIVTWTGTPQTNAGSYPVTATVNDANYTGTASGTFVINKATATVTLSNLSQTYTGSPLTPSATTAPAGLNFTWTGAPDTNAGSYPVTATINDNNYTGSASGTFTINKATATVTLGNLTQTYTGSALTPSATTAPANLTIVWTGAPDTNAGSYPVTATINDSNYAGSASGTFLINKAAANVVLGNLTQTYTGSSLSPSATTTPAGLGITWTNAPQTAAGSYQVTAAINDNNYTGSASGTFVINKAVATVTLTNLSQTYTGSALSPGATTAPAGLNLTWTGTPQTNAGSYTVTATVNDPNYTGSASGTFLINKAVATVTLTGMTQTYTGSSLAPGATTAPAGLNLTWTGTPQTNAGSYPVTVAVVDANYTGSASGTFLINKAVATVVLNSLTQTYTGGALAPGATTTPAGLNLAWTGTPQINAGSYPVTAAVVDANYTGSAAGTFVIQKAVVTVTLSNMQQTYTGSALTPAASTSNPSGLAITWTGAPQTNAGSYSVTATVNEPNYQGSASGTFRIDKAPATVTLGNLNQTYTGGSLFPTATTDPSGLNVTWTGAPDTNAGSYNVTAAINNTNYTGSASGTFVIAPATPAVNVSGGPFAYNGQPHAATCTATGVNGATVTGTCSLTYNGSSAAPAGVGTYAVSASFTSSNSNYGSATGAGSITITPATPTVRVTGGIYIYDGQPHAAACAVTGVGGAAVAGTCSLTYTPGGLTPTLVGTYPVSAAFTSADTNYYSSNGSGSVSITPRPTTIVYTGATNGNYGDCGVPLSASLIDTLTGSSLVGETVTFILGTGSTAQTITAVTGPNGVALANFNLLQDPGTPTLTAVFAGDMSSPNYGEGPSQAQVTYTVHQDTNVGAVPGYALYTGSSFFWTTSSSSSTATLTLSTTLKGGSCRDGSATGADIRKATVTFGIRNGDGSVTPIPNAQNQPVGLVDPNDITTGTATAVSQWNIGNQNVQSLDVVVLIGGEYYHNLQADDALVTISKPGVAKSMVGGGMIDLSSVAYAPLSFPTSSGYLATVWAPGAQGYLKFSANVQYNKSGTNPQGGATLLFNSFNKANGTTDTVLHTYLIKSSSITELTLHSPGVMSFSAKSVIQDVTNPAAQVSVDGGATLQITVTRGTDGSPDLVAVSVQKKSGGMWLSTSWNGLTTAQKPLLSGTVAMNQ